MAVTPNANSTPPPPGKRGPRVGVVDWPAALARVEQKAGEWVRLGAYQTRGSAASTASRVKVQYDRDGRFEIACRSEKGRGVIYARLKAGA